MTAAQHGLLDGNSGWHFQSTESRSVGSGEPTLDVVYPRYSYAELTKPFLSEAGSASSGYWRAMPLFGDVRFFSRTPRPSLRGALGVQSRWEVTVRDKIRNRRSGVVPLASCRFPGLDRRGVDVGGPGSARVNPGRWFRAPFPPHTLRMGHTSELEIWAKQRRVARPVAVESIGSEAFIQNEPASSQWVLRGPDLEPSAEAIRTVRIRYRWAPDAGLQPGASRTGILTAYFAKASLAPDQPAARATISPQADWTVLDLAPGSFRTPLNVRYVYLHSFGNRGVFELDASSLSSNDSATKPLSQDPRTRAPRLSVVARCIGPLCWGRYTAGRCSLFSMFSRSLMP